MGGTSAEATGVGAGGIVELADLGRGLGEVATAALVLVAAGLLAAVDDVLDVILGDAGVLDGGEHGEDVAGLGGEVLEHVLGGEVVVDVVGALHDADERVVDVEALALAVVHDLLDLGELDALLDALHDALVDDLVGSELLLVGGNEVAVELDEVEHVHGLHEEVELGFGHHLAVLAVAVRDVAALVIVGELDAFELLGVLVADVDLIGPVTQIVLEGSQVAG